MNLGKSYPNLIFTKKANLVVIKFNVNLNPRQAWEIRSESILPVSNNKFHKKCTRS
jgi:hypothetical protein